MSKTTYIMATVVLAPTTDDLLPNAAWQQPSSAAHSVVADWLLAAAVAPNNKNYNLLASYIA